MRNLIAFCAAGLVGFGAMLFAPVAQAGQPWSCVCKGKPKRFIASTNKCGIDLLTAAGKSIPPGGRLRVARCNSSQFRVWNSKACKQEGCQPPKY